MQVAVFETNILISALLWPRGRVFECLDLARQGSVQSITCEPILNEFVERLRGKFGLEEQKARGAAEEVRRISNIVSISGTLRAVSDVDDDQVVECAVVGSATHIVTGDRRHLLPLKEYRGVQIVTAAEFVRLVRGSVT